MAEDLSRRARRFAARYAVRIRARRDERAHRRRPTAAILLLQRN